jgi:hypothetical protein
VRSAGRGSLWRSQFRQGRRYTDEVCRTFPTGKEARDYELRSAPRAGYTVHIRSVVTRRTGRTVSLRQLWS